MSTGLEVRMQNLASLIVNIRLGLLLPGFRILLVSHSNDSCPGTFMLKETSLRNR
jgi:hypothetical protein